MPKKPTPHPDSPAGKQKATLEAQALMRQVHERRGKPALKPEPTPSLIIQPDTSIVTVSQGPFIITKQADPDELPSLSQVEQELQRRKYNQLGKWYPDSGPFSRDKYPKHMRHFAAGKVHRERLMLGSNRSGKTVSGAYESSLHSTGQYPLWWPGKVFKGPTVGWVVNKSSIDVRDINQLEMMGKWGEFGSGMIPLSSIVDMKAKPNVPSALSIVYVRDKTGGMTEIHFKSYDQGRQAFQGRAVHWIWADEEIPHDVYTECLLRTMTTEGIIYCTYTPLHGLTRVTVDYLKHSVNVNELPFKFTAQEKSQLTAATLF